MQIGNKLKTTRSKFDVKKKKFEPMKMQIFVL